MSYLKEILVLLGDDKSKLPKMVLLFLAVSLLDAIGVGLIGPYISLIINPDSFDNEFFSKVVQFIGPFENNDIFLITVSLILVSVFLFKGLAGVFVLKVITDFSYRRQVHLRSQLMHVYQSMSYVDYIDRNSAEYVYAVQDLVSKFTGKIMMLGLKTISDILIALTLIMVLAWTDIELLFMLLLLVGAVSLIYDRLIRKSVELYGKDANIASTKLVKHLSEGIGGMKEVRVLGKANYFHSSVYDEAVNYANNLKITEVLTNIPRHLIEFSLILFLTIVVVLELLNNGNIVDLLPTLAMFGVASLKLVPSVNSIANGVIQLRFNRNTVSLLFNDVRKFKALKRQNRMSSDKKFDSIELNSLSFQYPKAQTQAISNISLSIKNGESIGLIGSSGSGKTTLVDVILGLLVPSEGEIFLNGEKINDNMQEWQRMVAYLPQEVFIIDDTLKNNIALGVDPKDINDKDLKDALERSKLKEVISNLPEGVNTRLGERGISLSGGQRQRVAIARAIYHKREVLVMDEATSALDEQTEREVVNEIKRLKGNVTMIIIAHRHKTLAYCDRIYRLSNGCIVESLTYRDLIDGKRE